MIYKSNSFLKILLISFFIIFLSNIVKAQSNQGEFIKASIGLGISIPSDNVNQRYQEDVNGNGFYAQGEYIFARNKWFSLRPYAGVIFTHPVKNTDEQIQSPYKATANALLLGGKTRILAPIPWVAPFIELGVGTSIGSFETFTPVTNLKKNGILFHIPWSIGLAVGRKHEIEIEFTYYEHPSVNQTVGAAAFGITFPVN